MTTQICSGPRPRRPQARRVTGGALGIARPPRAPGWQTWGKDPDAALAPTGSDSTRQQSAARPIGDAMTDTIVPDDNFAEFPGKHGNSVASVGLCPSCGAFLPLTGGRAGNGIVLRTAVPQPMAAALLMTSTLSPRERAVFQFLSFGYDNRSIARRLRVSERTVKRHVTVILSKLSLNSRLQAGLTALILFSSAGTAGGADHLTEHIPSSPPESPP